MLQQNWCLPWSKFQEWVCLITRDNLTGKEPVRFTPKETVRAERRIPSAVFSLLISFFQAQARQLRNGLPRNLPGLPATGLVQSLKVIMKDAQTAARAKGEFYDNTDVVSTPTGMYMSMCTRMTYSHDLTKL